MKINEFVRRCITIKKFFYSFCGIVFFADIPVIKFSARNKKMCNGERFITGYTKRRLFISEEISLCQSGVSNSTSGDFGLVLSTVA